jgi:RuvB C-terminal winged helix domain
MESLVRIPSTAATSALIEDVYEPYRLQQGYRGRTTRGRVATREAHEHLKVPVAGTQAERALRRVTAGHGGSNVSVFPGSAPSSSGGA